MRAACKRHLDDIVLGKRRGLYWDVGDAKRAMRFFEVVLHLAGGQFEGEPFLLHPSQEFIVGSLFGWKRADGTRRFRRAYIEEGKGNGKSPLLAGMGLYALVADQEARAEVYAAGAKRDQAMVMFRDAVAMVDQSPKLNEKVHRTGVNPVWNLHYRGSFFRPIANDDSQSGPRPHFALCDEIHEHKNGDVVNMLERGFKFRRQPLLVMATNSGSDRNSFCWEEHDFAVKVAEQRPDVNPRTLDAAFSYVCALDEGDDPINDPRCWTKANPLLNVTITHEWLGEQVQLARAIPGKLSSILRLHFCVWTDAANPAFSREVVEPCLADFDPAEHAGKTVHIGLDLSATTDLTAKAAVVKTGEVERESDGRKVMLPTYDAWVEAWTPGDTLVARAERDQAPYDVWAKQGWLHVIPGKVIRFDFVAAALARDAETYVIACAAYDRYAFRKLEAECDEMGLTLNFVEHPQGGKRRGKPTPEMLEVAKMDNEEEPQGLWMPGSLKFFTTLLLDRRIRIRASPVVISAIMSAVTETDAFDNSWLSKRKATNRIDAAVALCIAVGAAEANIQPGGVDVGDFLANAVIG